jgi:hypothetical protein
MLGFFEPKLAERELFIPGFPYKSNIPQKIPKHQGKSDL